jgi:serine/threonine-protein kinase
MTDIKKYEPLWGTWFVESLLGEGSFGKVYKIHRRESVWNQPGLDRINYAAVKIISIPQYQSEIQQMRNEGLDESAINYLIDDFVKKIISEINLMKEFHGNKNIVCFEDYKIIKQSGSIGWDILIRMELLTSLAEYVARAPLGAEGYQLEAEVIKLGIQICRALELCAQKNIIHRDIKPENIFVTAEGGYKLGDFGIARHVDGTMSGLSKKGTYHYMAPEVFRGEKYGTSVDTYSLGIVMYSLMNQNRIPFLPDYPQSIVLNDREKALRIRMSGKQIPVLKKASPELNAIVLKACAYNRKERYAKASKMREALEKLLRARRALIPKKTPTQKHVSNKIQTHAPNPAENSFMMPVPGPMGKDRNIYANNKNIYAAEHMEEIVPTKPAKTWNLIPIIIMLLSLIGISIALLISNLL